MKNLIPQLFDTIKKLFLVPSTYILILLGICLGIGITLSSRTIRYTAYVPPTVVDITPQKAYEAILAGKKILFIDVRTPQEYAEVHATTSINIPIHLLHEKLGSLPRNTDTDIYLICNGGKLAGVAYSYLEHYGFRNIKRIDGGINAWTKAGLPVITKDILEIISKNSSLKSPSDCV